jgi:FkbM family methyltransferase
MRRLYNQLKSEKMLQITDIENQQVWTKLIVGLIRLSGSCLYLVGFKGFWRVSKYLGSLTNSTITIKRDELFLTFNMQDPYWNRLVYKNYVYEPEIFTFISDNYNRFDSFIDIGANIGYWSLQAKKKGGFNRVVAIEPNPNVCSQLRNNVRDNNAEINILECAVGAKAGSANLYVGHHVWDHAAASLNRIQGSNVIVHEVTVLNLDLYILKEFQSNEKILIKLDIEGAEAALFRESNFIYDKRISFIYEDHGSDMSCIATDWLLNNSSREIFMLTSSGSNVKIDSVKQLRSLKTDKSRGYNLICL